MRSTRYPVPTADQLRELAQRQSCDVASVLLPPLPTAEARLTLRNLIKEVELRLADAPQANGHDVGLLTEALEDHEVWNGPVASLALYVNGSSLVRMPGPEGGDPLAVIAPRFHVAHLLGAIPTVRYAVLALSRGSTHLYRGTGSTLTETKTAGFPAIMSEVLRYDDREPQLQSHGSGRRGAGGVVATFHGQGGRNDQEEDVARYLRFVAAEVEEVLGGEPLVLAATDELAAAFRRLSNYAAIAADHIPGNAERRSVAELASGAGEIVRAAALAERSDAIVALQEHPTAKVVYDIGEVVTAAYDGRVERLAFVAGERVWGEYDRSDRRVTELGEATSGLDLVNEAAAETWLHGGEVMAATGGEVVGPWQVAGLLRF